MNTNPHEKFIRWINLLFWGSMVLQFVALAAIFVGLIARGYKHHWGIWFTIGGWTAFASGFVIRSWVRRWEYRKLP